MRRALVIGANRGIGLEIARGLVAEGHEVLLGSRDPPVGASAAEAVGGTPLQIDVADPSSVNRAAGEAGRCARQQCRCIGIGRRARRLG